MSKITDVARLAGVSPSTVSHVLNGKRPISQPTRDRVMAAIRELNYKPNLNARALKSSQSGIIGFFAADITEIFTNEIIRGVESVIVPEGGHLLLVSGSEFSNNLQQAVDFLNTRSIDGIIISHAILQEKGTPELEYGKVPLITINSLLSEKLPSILPDNRGSGREAASHLYGKGVRKVAILAGPKDRLSSKRRTEGFIERAKELGLDIETVIHSEFTFNGGFDAAGRLLDGDWSIDGIFCANDYIAAGAITAAQRMGIDIPGRIKVIGFDDRDFAAFWPTPITTFRHSLYDMGRTGARYLKEYIEQGSPIPLVTRFPFSLQVRESSGG